MPPSLFRSKPANTEALLNAGKANLLHLDVLSRISKHSQNTFVRNPKIRNIRTLISVLKEKPRQKSVNTFPIFPKDTATVPPTLISRKGSRRMNRCRIFPTPSRGMKTSRSKTNITMRSSMDSTTKKAM